MLRRRQMLLHRCIGWVKAGVGCHAGGLHLHRRNGTKVQPSAHHEPRLLPILLGVGESLLQTGTWNSNGNSVSARSVALPDANRTNDRTRKSSSRCMEHLLGALFTPHGYIIWSRRGIDLEPLVRYA